MKNFQDLTVNDYLRIVRRRIWYLIVPALLVSIGTAVYVWRMPSIYKSETSILVSDRLLPEDYIGSLVKQTVVDRIEFAKQQLRSRTFVERIAQEFQLGGSPGRTDQVLDAVINSTELTVVLPNVLKVGFNSTDPSVAQAVTRRLAERVIQTNDSFRQEKVNTADQFLEEQLRQAADDLASAEQKLRAFYQLHFPGMPEQDVSVETLNVMQTQLAVTQTDLQAAIDQSKAYARSLAEHRELKLAATTPKPAPPTPAPKAASSSLVVSPLELSLLQKKAELAALLTRYTPEHPDVGRVRREVRELESQVAAAPPASEPEPSASAAIPPSGQTDIKPLPEIDIAVDFYEAEVRRELDQLNSEIRKKETLAAELSKKVAAYGRRMNMQPEMVQELTSLTQNREAAKQRHTYLASRKLNSDLSGKVDTNINNKTFTTIDPPNLPQTPVRPDRWMLTSVGCLAGLALGIGFVIARESLDPTLSDEESAAAALKLPIFTSIPTVGSPKREAKKRKKEASARRKQQRVAGLALSPNVAKPDGEFALHLANGSIGDVILGPHRVAGEQFQMMRAELVAQRQRGSKSLMVTSSVPNEGKTFIASCLAGILAKDPQKKVLLIDGDLRTANAGQVMGLEDRNSVDGLSDVLGGKADVENCLISCAGLNLTFLPAGRLVENPVELLSTPRLQQVMSDLTLLFDWVIVDSPPILPIADVSLLMQVCDSAIMVVRADKTPVRTIKDSINKLSRERVCGIVMNRVRDVKASHYYGYYYSQLTQKHK